MRPCTFPPGLPGWTGSGADSWVTGHRGEWPGKYQNRGWSFCEGRSHRASKRVFMTKHEANSSELNTEATGRPRSGAGGVTGTWAGAPHREGCPQQASSGHPKASRKQALQAPAGGTWGSEPSELQRRRHRCHEGPSCQTQATEGGCPSLQPQQSNPRGVSLPYWRDGVRHTSVLGRWPGFSRPLLRLLPQLARVPDSSVGCCLWAAPRSPPPHRGSLPSSQISTWKMKMQNK